MHQYLFHDFLFYLLTGIIALRYFILTIHRLILPPVLLISLVFFINAAQSNQKLNSIHEHSCDNHSPCYTNQLIHEKSPYLLQHAHNPVNWYAWNTESLEKARQENKAIFLSIGYAACHWCHVMERQSFNDPDIAKILNKYFIAIKVDREQRTDIDDFYGNAVMQMTGQLGWPMSVFLTPDKKPFHGGGYYNRDEFMALLMKMSDYWNNHQQLAIDKAQSLINDLRAMDKTHQGARKINENSRLKALRSLFSITDTYNGGFGEASKFPREPWLYLLLDESYAKPVNSDAFAALKLSLSQMQNGGIYDQIGGGFHRYTTDPYWKIPHFEKMLYNQALLIRLYLRVNTIQFDPLFIETARQTARQTADFILNEMQSPKGGFYSSLNAESDEEEGKFYLWHINDWNSQVDEIDRELFTEFYDIDEYGETDNEKNVLYRALTLEELAQQKKIPISILQTKLELFRKKLLRIRNLRPRPDIDKKIIMGWNSLTITALAEASLNLNDTAYLKAAKKTANYIWNSMQVDDHFYRISLNNQYSQIAQLDDYAFYLQALITLYDIDKNSIWLNRARRIAEIINNDFWDTKDSGYFKVSSDQHSLLPYRAKTAFDKTLPSANAIISQMLIRLYRRTGDNQYIDRANQIFSAFAESLNETPSAYSTLLIASNELGNGEKDLPVYSAHGNIRIDAFILKNSSNDYDLTVKIQIADKWHINSSQPFSRQLIATQIELIDNHNWDLKDIQYPQSDIVKTSFSKQNMALYQDDIIIQAHLKKHTNKTNPAIKIKLQACNDKICLAPDELVLYPRLLIKN